MKRGIVFQGVSVLIALILCSISCPSLIDLKFIKRSPYFQVMLNKCIPRTLWLDDVFKNLNFNILILTIYKCTRNLTIVVVGDAHSRCWCTESRRFCLSVLLLETRNRSIVFRIMWQSKKTRMETVGHCNCLQLKFTRDTINLKHCIYWKWIISRNYAFFIDHLLEELCIIVKKA